MAARSQLQHNLRSVLDQSKSSVSLVSGLGLINSQGTPDTGQPNFPFTVCDMLGNIEFRDLSHRL